MTDEITATPSDENLIIFHLCRWEDWHDGLQKGVYTGSPEARKDGFLHFSVAKEVQESAHLHMSGLEDLYVLIVAAKDLQDLIRWEPAESRKSVLFPHVYGDVPVDAVISALPVPLGADGSYIFPDLDLF